MKLRQLFVGLSTLLLLVSLSIVKAPPARASVQDFDIDAFEANYYVDKTKSHGHMKVDEQITVTFHDFNHGILRAIPETYKGHSLRLEIDSVEANLTSANLTVAPYTSSSQNDNLVLKIGDPNHTVTGEHIFHIVYEVDNPITFYNDHDELFWDINGDQWDQSFFKTTVTIHDSDGVTAIKTGNLAPRCFSGGFGSAQTNCLITTTNAQITSTANTTLSARQTLSILIAYPKGTFQPFTWLDFVGEHVALLSLSFLWLLLIIGAFHRWWRHGRDHRGRGVIVPEYGPPKGISVLKSGVLMDYNLDTQDLTATIIDLAVRGYIKIIEEQKTSLLLMKSRKFTLELVNPDTSKLEAEGATILQSLFDDFTPGAQISLGKYIAGLQKVSRQLSKDMYQQLTDDGYFDQDPSKARNSLRLYSVPMLVLFFGAIVFHVYAIVLFGVVGILVVNLLASFMPRRSPKGVAAYEQLQGLKLYLKTAEADRIKMLQSPDSPYAEDATAPVRSVKLFEKLLPYAIIFGVEKEWAKQFADMYKQPPNWYVGNWTAFNAVLLTEHIGMASTAITTSFNPPSSSGGSGFSGGGGFAGGGGGGGGGGGW